MKEEIKTVEGRVEVLLQKYPMLRSSDKMLMASYLKIYHGIDTFKQYALSKGIPSVETIRRTRQKIQAEGRCLATEETKMLRDAAFEDYKDYAVGR